MHGRVPKCKDCRTNLWVVEHPHWEDVWICNLCSELVEEAEETGTSGGKFTLVADRVGVDAARRVCSGGPPVAGKLEEVVDVGPNQFRLV